MSISLSGTWGVCPYVWGEMCAYFADWKNKQRSVSFVPHVLESVGYKRVFAHWILLIRLLFVTLAATCVVPCTVRMCVCRYVCVYVRRYIFMYVCVCECMYVHMFACVVACIYI